LDIGDNLSVIAKLQHTFQRMRRKSAKHNLPGPKRKDPWMRDISFEKLAKKPLCDYENNWELHA
jgi:hypothetical protein